MENSLGKEHLQNINQEQKMSEIPNIKTNYHGNTQRWESVCDETDYVGTGDSYEESQEDLLDYLDLLETNSCGYI